METSSALWTVSGYIYAYTGQASVNVNIYEKSVDFYTWEMQFHIHGNPAYCRKSVYIEKQILDVLQTQCFREILPPTEWNSNLRRTRTGKKRAPA